MVRKIMFRNNRLRARLFAPLAVAAMAALIFGSGCGDDDDDDANPASPASDPRTEFGLEPLPAVIYPADNPPAQERIALGRLLFHDPILSGHLDVSCATCHHAAFAFGDKRQLSVGVAGAGLGPDRILTDPVNFHMVPRNSPTIWNVACNINAQGEPDQDGFMFHDGRVNGLEAQASKPIGSRVEMRGDAYAEEDALDSVLARLRSIDDYVDRFALAFPGDLVKAGGSAADVIDSSTYSRAMAAYERELVAGNSPYDRYVLGDDGAINQFQMEGLKLFFGKANCATCHGGPMLGDFQFRVIGVPQVGPGKDAIPGDDAGRMEHTGNEEDKYAFRTLSLRNVELTPPYMHDGFFNSLEEVVRFHNDGAQPRHGEVTDEMLDPLMTGPLGLTDDEVQALVQFLRSLTDPGTMIDPYLLSVPNEVPSGLMPVFGVAGPGVGKGRD